jgi:hypothetical protein
MCGTRWRYWSNRDQYRWSMLGRSFRRFRRGYRQNDISLVSRTHHQQQRYTWVKATGSQHPFAQCKYYLSILPDFHLTRIDNEPHDYFFSAWVIWAPLLAFSSALLAAATSSEYRTNRRHVVSPSSSKVDYLTGTCSIGV